MKIVRLMCTGRVDLAFVLRAFAKGADGVFIGGCWLGECHYVTEGNYDALANAYLCKKLMAHIGLSPERLRLEWVAASEGSRFAEVTTDFIAKLRALGPLRSDGEAAERELARKLEAVLRLVPYIKLCEREKLRVPVKSPQAYQAFFEGEQFHRLFEELIAAKVSVSQIVSLLGEGPRSTREIGQALGLSSSEVSRHLGESTRLGLVTYDVEHKHFALAQQVSAGGPR